MLEEKFRITELPLRLNCSDSTLFETRSWGNLWTNKRAILSETEDQTELVVVVSKIYAN